MSKQTDPAIHPKEVELPLPATGTWLASHYLLDGKAQDALKLAVACGRPLLVRGLPGTGKSDLARAAAEFLKREFIYEVVTARTEPQDLLWHFDAIARLADAQAQAKSCSPDSYVRPGSMWWALNRDSAQVQQAKYDKRAAECLAEQKEEPQNTPADKQKMGTVLLLDEIDKADSELPNSLLEVLANTGFKKTWSTSTVKPDGRQKPLIIITTNEDRELPPAFVRRCLVLNIAAAADFSRWIKKRARVHFHDPEQADNKHDLPDLTAAVLDAAAKQLMQDREEHGNDTPKPGLAEYLDLLRGLYHMAAGDEAQQLALLERVSQFSYKKHP